MSKRPRYYLLFKPYGYLSQFTKEHPDHKTLAELCVGIPKDVFPVGRLDKDSEGLLLLTSDKNVNARLLNPQFKHNRTYLVGKSRYDCMPCDVKALSDSPNLPDRNPPIRVRKTVPDTWLELTLREGKNRQVRKMCAAVGHPVLRLLRCSIEGLNLIGMALGELKEVEREAFYELLKLR